MEIKEQRIPTAYFWENYRTTDDSKTGELFRELYKDISVLYLNNIEAYLLNFAKDIIKDKNITKMILALSLYKNHKNKNIIKPLKFLEKNWDLSFLIDPVFYNSLPKEIDVEIWETEIIPIVKQVLSKKEGEMMFRKKSISRRKKSRKRRSKSGGSRKKRRSNSTKKKKRSRK